jgi:tripartite-type tricarboxylate transporter receptor subunit TctC
MLRRTMLQGLPFAAIGLPFMVRLATPGARAQDAAAGYPEKPVTIIVPFAAGSNTPAVTRMSSRD